MALLYDLNRFFQDFASFMPSSGPLTDEERPGDPGIGVLEPLRRHPGGRAGGVALLEPDDELVTADAVAGSRRF
jgi:hypothetical protein